MPTIEAGESMILDDENQSLVSRKHSRKGYKLCKTTTFSYVSSRPFLVRMPSYLSNPMFPSEFIVFVDVHIP